MEDLEIHPAKMFDGFLRKAHISSISHLQRLFFETMSFVPIFGGLLSAFVCSFDNKCYGLATGVGFFFCLQPRVVLKCELTLTCFFFGFSNSLLSFRLFGVRVINIFTLIFFIDISFVLPPPPQLAFIILVPFFRSFSQEVEKVVVLVSRILNGKRPLKLHFGYKKKTELDK